MNPSLWNKQIPTYAGFVFLIVGVIVTAVLVRTGVLFPIRATPSEEPKEMRISNVSDTSFTVSYITAGDVTGSLAYGETANFGSVALDERDKAGNTSTPHTVHYFVVSNVNPGTTYQFAILSGTKTFTGPEYTVKTASSIEEPAGEKIITGSLLLPDGTKPQEAIIYVESSGTQVLSTFAVGGNYSVSLTHLRSENLESYVTLPPEAFLLIAATSGSLHSTAEVTAGQAEIPQITLSQQYEFTLISTSPGPGESTTTPDGEQVDPTTQAFPKFAPDAATNTDPQILTPQKNEEFSDLQPEFTGTAPPGGTIEIVIESSHEIKATVKADSSGRWSYRPEQPLEPGEHTITITTRDEAGIVQKVLQSFVVNAQGSQFTQPSASPTRRPTNTPTPTITPTTPPSVTPPGATITTTPTTTPSPTSVPTVTIAPSITASPSPTLRPTVPIITTTAGPTQPVMTPPGSGELMVSIGLAGFVILLGGMVFFFTQGIM